MRTARNISLILFFTFFILAIGGGLFWANLNFTQRVPGGADFIGPWKALQNVALNGISPYGEVTKQEVQQLIYGRAALPGEYPYRVDLPFHLLILFLPFSSIRDLTLARAVWMLFLEAALFSMVGLSLAQSRWKLHWLFLIFAMLFCTFWMPSVSALFTGNSIILQAFCLVGALRAIEKQADELGGALLALALVNLQATGMVILLIFVWAFSVQRWRIFYGLGMILVILIGVSVVLLPSWELPFLGAVVGNWRAEALPSTFSLFTTWFPGIGRRLAQILAIVTLTILLLEWSAVRGKDVRWLFWTASVTAAITPLLGLPFLPVWLGFTIPGLLLAVSALGQRWGPLGLVSAFLILVIVFLGLWVAQLQGLTALFLLGYPLFLSLILYWVRWAAIRPPRLWADQIAQRG